MNGTRNPIPIFYGNNSEDFDVLHWLKQAELASMCYEWTEHKSIMMAFLSLRGPALIWVDTLGNDYTWETFKEQMIQRFGEQPPEIMDRLHCRFQSSSESIGAFTDDYLNLLNRASQTGNAIPERLKLTGYIEGLLSNIQEFLILKEPETLAEAVRIAKYLEFQVQRLKSQGRKSVFSSTGQENKVRNQGYRDQQNQRSEHAGQPYRNNNNLNSHTNNNFNARQADKQQPPKWQNVRNVDLESTEMADLARQMTDLQIKMSQIENSYDFNHFTFEKFQNYYPQHEEREYYDIEPMKFDPYLEEKSISQEAEAEEYKNQCCTTTEIMTPTTAVYTMTGMQENILTSILTLIPLCQMLLL